MLFSFITHTRSVWLRVGGGWVVVGVEGMEGRCCWWWEEENLVFQRILCSLHLSMHVHPDLTLTLTEQILFSGWIHAHQWFSCETYFLSSIWAHYLFLWSACISPNVALVMDHAAYWTDDNAEPHDFLVFSIKRTPRHYFEMLELFGDRLRRIPTCRGKWRHGR